MNESKYILKKYWGFDDFRPFQKQIISNIYKYERVLALLPTGGGKSICFQVPILSKAGIGIVISPLIALMEDQVKNLRDRGIKAELITSNQNSKKIDIILDNCIYNEVKFLYVSPERLMTEIFIERLKRMNVNYIVIDEAHCISQWGYDFRPSYFKINKIFEHIKTKFNLIALTATATKNTIEDICTSLEIHKKNVYKAPFIRENIKINIEFTENKINRIYNLLSSNKLCSIIYCVTRKRVEEICNELKTKGLSIDYYHAGLDSNTRNRKQEDWLQGRTKIICATNAFGMGIDKSDVRIVIHIGVPYSPEAYFQEIGRAGRDEKKSLALMLYNENDLVFLKENFEREFPSRETISRVYLGLANYFQIAIGSFPQKSFMFDIKEFSDRFKFSIIDVFNSIKILERAEYINLIEANSHTTIKAISNKIDFYNYIIKNKNFENLYHYLTRNYEGFFSNEVELDLYKLSKSINYPLKQIIKDLFYLKRLNFIEFENQKSGLQIIFTKERIKDSNLYISKNIYEDRKKVKKYMLDYMIKFCNESNVCRNRILLSYFDEDNIKDCGNCDICNNDNVLDIINQNEFEQIRDKILIFNKENKFNEYEIIEHLSNKYNLLKIKYVLRNLKNE